MHVFWTTSSRSLQWSCPHLISWCTAATEGIFTTCITVMGIGQVFMEVLPSHAFTSVQYETTFPMVQEDLGRLTNAYECIYHIFQPATITSSSYQGTRLIEVRFSCISSFRYFHIRVIRNHISPQSQATWGWLLNACKGALESIL